MGQSGKGRDSDLSLVMATQTTIIPHSQKPYVTRTYPSVDDIDKIVQSAVVAQKAWTAIPLQDRIAIARKFIVRIPQIHHPATVLSDLVTG